MPSNDITVTIEDATIIWPNFSGNPTTFDPEGGTRKFNLVLEDDLAEKMAADGWNIKTRVFQGDDDKEDQFYHVEVAVGYKFRPPHIVLINSVGRQVITEETVSMLDSVDIANVDLVVRARPWESQASGKSGLKAYLQTMFVTVNEDELMRKYAMLETEE